MLTSFRLVSVQSLWPSPNEGDNDSRNSSVFDAKLSLKCLRSRSLHNILLLIPSPSTNQIPLFRDLITLICVTLVSTCKHMVLTRSRRKSLDLQPTGPETASVGPPRSLTRRTRTKSSEKSEAPAHEVVSAVPGLETSSPNTKSCKARSYQVTERRLSFIYMFPRTFLKK